MAAIPDVLRSPCSGGLRAQLVVDSNWGPLHWRLLHRHLLHWGLLAGGLLVFAIASPAAAQTDAASAWWRRHVIDNQSRGADGVRVADVNRDGLPDLTTGWEEGGRVRVYLHPGAQDAVKPWPAVTVGNVRSPEDAVFADVDGDGAVDVVSSCEGKERTMFVHWAPTKGSDYLDPDAWRTQPIPCTANQQMWMYAAPLDVDRNGAVDLVVGAKGKNAAVGLILTERHGRNIDAFRYVRLVDAGWIMSIELMDMDADGDLDIVYSDRTGPRRGVWWLQHPGAELAENPEHWRARRLGGEQLEVMFLDILPREPLPPEPVLSDSAVGKPRGPTASRIVVATRNGVILVLERTLADKGRAVGQTLDDGPWTSRTIANPLNTPHGKAVRAADLDQDGRDDLVHSANNGGRREHHGVVMLRSTGSDRDQWQVQSISGPKGVKFDQLQLIDIDRDGDLDVVTCEERDNLGVFWYENPARP